MKSRIFKLFVLIVFLMAGVFSCTKDGDTNDDNMVSIKIQDLYTEKVDPYIVSFALPGIVDARCYETPPYHSYGGFPEVWGPCDWSIHLVMEKGTDRTKLAPIITLAPDVTITPESGTVLDFTKNIEWTLKTPDGTTAKYYIASIFVEGDTDEENMVSIKIQDTNTGAVDPYIVSLVLPGIVQTVITEYLPQPNYGGIPEAWSPHEWSITFLMAKGTDCTKLAPIINLAPGAVIFQTREIIDGQLFPKTVNYTGNAFYGEYDFSQRIIFDLITPDGSTVTYGIVALAFGVPCINCP